MDNDIYTNAAFVLALETTLAAAAKLGISVSKSRLWQHIADKLKLQLVVFDGRLLHREYDQYTFSKSVNDTENPNKHGPKFLSHPSIGQADSCLLGFPLQFNDSARLWAGKKNEVRLNDISYYVSHLHSHECSVHTVSFSACSSCVSSDLVVPLCCTHRGPVFPRAEAT